MPRLYAWGYLAKLAIAVVHGLSSWVGLWIAPLPWQLAEHL